MPTASISCRVAAGTERSRSLREWSRKRGWVIERTFAIRQRRCRIGRNRWLARDFEGPIDATTAMVALAIIQLLDLFPPAEYANGGYPRSA